MSYSILILGVRSVIVIWKLSMYNMDVDSVLRKEKEFHYQINLIL